MVWGASGITFDPQLAKYWATGRILRALLPCIFKIEKQTQSDSSRASAFGKGPMAFRHGLFVLAKTGVWFILGIEPGGAGNTCEDVVFRSL
jgi:hypothetical protein